MDEVEIAMIARKCRVLKYKFSGVYAADNVPSLERRNSFQIVNADSSSLAGSHWMAVCRRGDTIIFADPLGKSLSSYQTLYRRMCSLYSSVQDFSSGYSIQPMQSNLCGLFSLYYAHIILGNEFPKLIAVSLPMLKRFVQSHIL